MIHDKLVRDNVPAILIAKGLKVRAEILTDGKAIAKALDAKILEEANEVTNAETVGQITEELADLLTVMEAVAKYYEIPWENIMSTKAIKDIEKGTFDSLIFLYASVKVN